MTQENGSNPNTLVTQEDVLLVAEEWIKSNTEFKNQILIAAKARIKIEMANQKVSDKEAVGK